jgi:isocitrate dehydrogenase (NAD+)
MMLHHLGEQSAATRIEEALLTVYRRDEVRTGDLGGTASTSQFTDAVCRAMG